jgi:hypothetical protein
MTVSRKFMLDLIYFAHPPPAKQTHDAVLPEGRTGLKGIGFVANEIQTLKH